MQCPYCGYEYDDKEPKCPFCATENTGVAREQQQAVFRSLDQETEEIRRMPEKMRKQTDRKAAGIFIIVLAFIIFLTVLIILASFGIRTFQSHSTERNSEKMETLLQEKDFDGLMALADELDSYDPAYDKYFEVVYTYRSMSYLTEDLEWFYDAREDSYSTWEIMASSLSYAICDCMNALSTGREYLDDGLILGNEDALENICSQAENTLTLTFRLTEEEIQELLDMELYYYDSESVLPYAELALERME